MANNFPKSDSSFSEKEISSGKGEEILKSPEIQELKERIERLEVQLKKEKVRVPEEREKILKQEISDYLENLQETPSFAAPLKVRDEAKEIEKFPHGQQVGALVSLVLDDKSGKGLKKAISIARSLNPAILDEFHDTLVDRYYKNLVDKKIIKPS